ncbi:MAG: branched-chain amino acid transport system permease protein [Micromonosporaceae bacterium]|nr:branched-chain amino acid transport system permease protein [Micromonosporaceae bacterium]
MRVSGRPMLYTSYSSEMALLNTTTKKVMLSLLLVFGIVAPFLFLDQDLQLLATGCIYAIGAIGLGLVTGYAGQVSLGHAFFLGIGAYTAAIISGDPNGRTLGYGVEEILVWLPAAGVAAAVAGIIVAPLATRLRGLYLAIVTLGLVFIGEHFFKELSDISGGTNIGRPAPVPSLFGQRLDVSGSLFSKDQKIYWLVFGLLVILALAARNIARSRIGRAFTAIRDRDIAAGVMGIDLRRYKTIAFAVSSFYAGCAGALLYIVTGFFVPEAFNLELSVLFVAMILVGGAGTISGAILGAFFFTFLGRITRELSALGLISSSATEVPNVFQLQLVLYGALIIVFLIFEPRGLFGIWLRVRNYWKAWPFSY